jgi:hypothetical protein
MPARRPGAVTAAGVMAIIYGSLFTLCGMCGVVSLAAQGAIGNNMFVGDDPMQVQMQNQVQAALIRDVPGYEAFQAAGTVLGLCEAVAILLAGIGILNVQRWARTLALVACLVAIATTLFQTVYQAVYVMPVMSEAFQVALPAAMPQAAGPQGAQALKFMETMMILVSAVMVAVYIVIIVYLGIIVILLCRRHVRAAFNAPGQADLEDHRAEDESRPTGYDDDDEWDRPRR